MGGLVSRIMVTDANLTFWNEFFGKPPDQVAMNPQAKRLLKRALIFNHRTDVSRVISTDPSVQKAKKLRIPTSIDTLSPKNRFVRTLNRLPIADHIPYHSIIGDRGRGDTPNSSDGVVPYWSSHLDGAQSEKLVPPAHGAHQNPQGMDEVERILRLNCAAKVNIAQTPKCAVCLAAP